MVGPRRQVTAPVRTPGEQAARAPTARAGRRPTPGGPARRRTPPWSPRRRRRGRRARPRRPRAAPPCPGHPRPRPGRPAVRVGGGLGGALGAERQGAADPQATTATASPATGCQAVASTRDDDRAEHEDRLVGDGLERVRRLHVAPAPSSTCDQRARTHEPIWGSAPPASGGGGVRRADRPAGLDRPPSAATSATAKTEARARRAPGPGRGGRRAGPAGSRGRRWRPCTPPRRRPRAPYEPVRGRDQQHDAQADHGDRQPRDQPGER